MTPDDDRPDWLRAQLDRELEPLVTRPGALGDVLRRGRQHQPWWRRTFGPVGVPAWFVAAAAVVVVALAVPLLARGLLGGNGGPPDRLASAPMSTALPSTSPAPSPGARMTNSPTGTPTGGVTPPAVAATPARSDAVTVSPSAPAAVTSPPASCAAGAPTGSGALEAQVDLDGDGRADSVSYDGTTASLVVQLSRGGGASTPFTTGSPYVAVLPVETDAGAGSELLVITRGAIGSDGSVGQNAVLYDLSGCAFGPVLNAQGTPYTFDIGSAEADVRRFGIACRGDTLLGITSVRDVKGDWDVTRTPVSSVTGRALNGRSTVSTVAAGSAAAAALTDSTCGSASPQSLG